MAEVAYLSDSGEVKIPLRIRTRMGVKPGQKFEVHVQGREIRLLQMDLPSVEQVRDFVAWAHKQPKTNRSRSHANPSVRVLLAQAKPGRARKRSRRT